MSTRLPYTIDALRTQIKAKHAAEANTIEGDYAHAMNIKARRDEWRATEEKRVRALSRGLAKLSDAELSSFNLAPYPALSRYGDPGRDRDQAHERADLACERALARLEALHAPDGTVDLTANMLRDWFSL